jgi:Uma2 family endonuclease
MVATPHRPSPGRSPVITWEKLPDDFVLPDDPVDNINQPALAAALGDGLDRTSIDLTNAILSTNYGICATLDGTTVVKAPDWAYIPNRIVSVAEVERSYTPRLQGDIPAIVLEFLSATDGGEYSIRKKPPCGKWFFYEEVLKVPTYGIFDPDGGLLEVYRRTNGAYELEQPDSDGLHWMPDLNLFLGTWQGQRLTRQGYWLRWWDSDRNLILWDAEFAAAAVQQAEAEKQRADRLAEYLRSQGLDPDQLA